MGGFGDDDDLFSDFPGDDDDGEDEDEIADEPLPQKHLPERVAPGSGVREKPGKRKVRLRPMTTKMRVKHPDAVSIAITRNDGRQLIFVR